MKSIILTGILLGCLLSCHTQTPVKETVTSEQLLKEIEQLEMQLLKIQDATKAPNVAAAIIDKSLGFTKNYSDHPQAAEWLFKSGDIARGLKTPDRAIQIWQQLLDAYPQSEYAPKALFAQGFTADADAKNPLVAKKYYQDFLIKYPEHEYSGQVKLLLSVLGETSEELIQQFEKSTKN